MCFAAGSAASAAAPSPHDPRGLLPGEGEQAQQADDAAGDWAEDWDDGESGAALASGYLEAALSLRQRADPRFDTRATRSELKLQYEVARTFGQAELSARVDLHADAVLDEVRIDVREAALALPLGERWNLLAGRQIATWGTGDLLFINDRFPKDFVTPLAGGEDYYFKAPSNTLRFAGAWAAFNLDLAYTPVFTPDRYIDGRRLGFYDERSGSRVGGADLIDARRPSATPGNGEWALRLHRSSEGVEYALYLNRGFDKQPRALDSAGRPAFLRRDAAGFSLRGPLAGGIASFEAAREWGRADADARAWVPDKRAAMAAFEKEVLPKFTAGVQFYAEWHAHDAGNPSSLDAASRRLVSLRLTRQALRDRLTLSAIQFYSPDQHDRWLRITVQQRFSDAWIGGLSLNDFGGRIDRFFGQLEPDGNLGIWLRRQF